MQEKTCFFFYFTHPLLQNTHISLFILHIYSIKYSFLTQYPATINNQCIGDHQPSLHHQPTQPPSSTQPSKSQNHWSKSSKPTNQNPLIKIIKQRKKIAVRSTPLPVAIDVSNSEFNPSTRNKGREIKQREALWWLAIGKRSNSERLVKV